MIALPSQVLDRAADLIEPKGRWTKGHYARDEHGEEVWPPAKTAACFCVYGAITVAGNFRHVSDAEYGCEANFLRRVVGRGAPQDRLDKWNDRKLRKQSEVVAALRKAAELARSEGQ